LTFTNVSSPERATTFIPAGSGFPRQAKDAQALSAQPFDLLPLPDKLQPLQDKLLRALTSVTAGIKDKELAK